MEWIKVYADLLGHPKTKRLCRLTGWDEDQAIGKLYRLWTFTVKYALDGDLSKFTPQDIEDALNFKPTEGSLVDMLVESGFLDREPCLRIHDWYTHVGKFINSKFSGNDDDDIAKRIKRAYKPMKKHRTVTVREQYGNSTIDKSKDVDVEKSETTSCKTTPARAHEDDTSKASPPEPSQNPENGHGAHTNGEEKNAPSLRDDRAEILMFIQERPPKDCAAAPFVPDGDFWIALDRYQIFGMQALWTIYVTPGHSGYAWAKKKQFHMRDFLHQIPHLTDGPNYPGLRREFEDASRKFSLSEVGLGP